MKGADLAIPVPESAQRVLTTGKQDAAVVFVRRGLVDRKGQPISFDEKAELFRIASVRLEVAK
jgi:hypothetical protein